MKLKDLARIKVGHKIFALVDRPDRRVNQRFERVADVKDIEITGRKMEEELEYGEKYVGRYQDDRRRLLTEVISRLLKRGIYGFRFESPSYPFTIWWYPTFSWTVTDIRRLMRSQSFRRFAAARSAVTISWTGEALGERELKLIEQVLGSNFVKQAKFSIKKADYESASGIQGPPVGTKQKAGPTKVELNPEWEDPAEPASTPAESS